jgi:Cohesin domain/PEP-CTERM motif
MRTRQFSALFWLLATPTALLADVVMSVQPATLDVTAGQSFTLTVQMSGVSDLYGYQFDLGFNPTIMEATSVTEGPFLATGGPTIFLPGTIDNVGGSITDNADILNGAVSGVDGGGTLLDVSFQALAAGPSTVQLFNVIALNSFGEGIDLTTSSSTVTVTGTAPVPEPGSGLLFGTVVIGLFGFLRSRSSRSLSS